MTLFECLMIKPTGNVEPKVSTHASTHAHTFCTCRTRASPIVMCIQKHLWSWTVTKVSTTKDLDLYIHTYIHTHNRSFNDQRFRYAYKYCSMHPIDCFDILNLNIPSTHKSDWNPCPCRCIQTDCVHGFARHTCLQTCLSRCSYQCLCQCHIHVCLSRCSCQCLSGR